MMRWRLWKTMNCLVLTVCLQGWSTTQAATLELVSKLAATNQANAVTVAGGYAYVADGNNGLAIIDVRNPATPLMTGRLATSGAAVEVAVQGSLAAVAVNKSGQGGTILVDVNDKAKPRQMSFIKSSGYQGDSGVALVGSTLYTLGTEGNVNPFSSLVSSNIANPTQPLEMDRLPLGDTTGRIAATDRYLAAAHLECGIRIYDITNPGILRLAGLYYTGNATDVAFLNANTLVYGTANEYYRVQVRAAGIHAMSFGEDGRMIPTGDYYTRENVNGICAKDDHVFVANDVDGVFVMNSFMGNPPKDQLARYKTDGRALDVAVDGTIVYVAASTGGLVILKYAPEAMPPVDKAQVVRHTVPSQMDIGSTVSASITMANLSPLAWTEAANYKLALLSDTGMLWTLPYPRVNIIKGVDVKPNDEYTFRFELRAPMQPGTYNLEFSMIREFVNLFGPKLSLAITVVDPNAHNSSNWHAYQ